MKDLIVFYLSYNCLGSRLVCRMVCYWINESSRSTHVCARQSSFTFGVRGERVRGLHGEIDYLLSEDIFDIVFLLDICLFFIFDRLALARNLTFIFVFFSLYYFCLGFKLSDCSAVTPFFF